MMNLKLLNNLVNNLENFYHIVLQHGWYLPKYNESCITVQYLQDVLEEKVFAIKRTEIRPITLHQRQSKIDLYSIFKDELKKKKPAL
jgi:hypothetical protein